jgi:phosphoribosylformylglycinamidine synthase
LLLLGPRSSVLTGSRWARSMHEHRGGELAPLDLDLHRRLVDLVVGLVREHLVDGIHDVADSGLGGCLAEMAAHSGVGATIGALDGHGELFSEAPSRVVVCVAAGRADAVGERAEAAKIPVHVLGEAGGDRLVVEGLVDLAVKTIKTTRTGMIPTALAAGALH